ncbi:MAG: DUF4417 domain-containing protein [Oscillospiraceae bacterium]|nr:DUF4417 domain-containing protein [Oscillospiraceae bacterium]
MTEEHYKYRTSPFLLRNQFPGKGKSQIPTIPKFQAREGDFTDLRLISFDKTKLENNNHLDRMVHFFLYDYKFKRVWRNPESDLEKLKRYRAVLSPDFSVYLEMAPAIQLYNTFRNRWCGAYYASKGIHVIPSVSWGGEDSFEFCFEGIEKGSTVAVSTYMVSAHNNRKDQKEFFLKGYNELLDRIEPERIICYNEPFPEMQGNIVFVDYELSSWRYMNDDPCVPSKYAKYICGALPWPEDCDIVRKTGYILPVDDVVKGMGSAYGGDWRPNPDKPEDERFLGKPGEVKNTNMPNGERYSTKIGENGRAVKERHWTDHKTPNVHSNPHDHNINWDPGRGNPIFEKPHINYPDGAPEFKSYEVKAMSNHIVLPKDHNMNFETISNFKWCMKANGEVQFKWNDKIYSIVHPIDGILITEAYKSETEKLCKDADDVLEYVIDGVRLRDIITKVKVTARTI